MREHRTRQHSDHNPQERLFNDAVSIYDWKVAPAFGSSHPEGGGTLGSKRELVVRLGVSLDLLKRAFRGGVVQAVFQQEEQAGRPIWASRLQRGAARSA